MKKNTTSIISLAIIYALMFILQVIALPASKWSVLLLCLTGAIASTHIHFAKKRNRQIDWSSINRPFAIIDWGEDGRDFELPAHHHGFYIACSAAKVYDNSIFVRAALSNSGNQAFIHSEMPVMEFYFRWEANVKETQEHYRARVIEAFDNALIEWHIKLAKQEKAYIKAFFSENQNGSVPE